MPLPRRLILVLLLILAAGPVAAAQDVRAEAVRPTDYIPPAFREAREKAGVDEKLDAQLPPDLVFTDQTGQMVRLGDFFDGTQPVVLQMAYYRCPQLCGEISQGMVRSMQALASDLGIGEDFRVITLSFDSREPPELAKENQRAAAAVLGRYTPPEAVEQGWSFLVGDDLNIKKLTEAIGYRFGWIAEAQEYSHPAVVVLLTPDGRVSRYLYGTNFDVQTMRLSLVNASQGTITPSLMDAFILTCFDFDPRKGKYSATAMTIMRVAGMMMVLVVVGVVGFLLVAESRGRALRLNQSGGGGGGDGR